MSSEAARIPDHDGASRYNCCYPPIPPRVISFIVQIYQRAPRRPFRSGTHGSFTAEEILLRASHGNEQGGKITIASNHRDRLGRGNDSIKAGKPRTTKD